MNISEQIEVFYKVFKYSKPNVMDDFILYSFNTKEQAASVVVEAKELIEKLQLNLKVEWNTNSQLFDKTILIKSNEE